MSKFRESFDATREAQAALLAQARSNSRSAPEVDCSEAAVAECRATLHALISEATPYLGSAPGHPVGTVERRTTGLLNQTTATVVTVYGKATPLHGYGKDLGLAITERGDFIQVGQLRSGYSGVFGYFWTGDTMEERAGHPRNSKRTIQWEYAPEVQASSQAWLAGWVQVVTAVLQPLGRTASRNPGRSGIWLTDNGLLIGHSPVDPHYMPLEPMLGRTLAI